MLPPLPPTTFRWLNTHKPTIMTKLTHQPQGICHENRSENKPYPLGTAVTTTTTTTATNILIITENNATCTLITPHRGTVMIMAQITNSDFHDSFKHVTALYKNNNSKHKSWLKQ